MRIQRKDAKAQSRIEQVLHVIAIFLVLVASALLSGCLISEAPFYEEKQIVQDSRIEGVFTNTGSQTGQPRADGSVWYIEKKADAPGKYRVTLTDGDATVELVATLFRLEGTLFLDLFPIRDSGMNHVPGGVTATEFLHGVMFQPRHVVWKVEFSTNGVAYSFPAGNGAAAAAKKAPELQSKMNPDAAIILLPNSPKESQKYLIQFAKDSSVFNYRGELMRKKGS